MATKISALAVGTTPASTDIVGAGVQGGATVSFTASAIAAYLATATLAAGTITTSQPMTLTQTWNAAGVTFTGFLVNITATASAAASLLADFQVASASVASITKAGGFKASNGSFSAPAFGVNGATQGLYGYGGNNGLGFCVASNPAMTLGKTSSTLLLANSYVLGWTSTSNPDTGAPDLLLSRDAANILAQKNSNADQTQRWYSTNSAYAQIQSLSESTTLSGATTDTAIQFPANCIPLGVTLNVTTLIAGATTFNVGDAASATRYGSGLALTAGTTNAQAGTTNPVIPSAGTKVRFTAVGGAASFSAGVVRVTLHYISLSAPTS